ncbi:MAG: DUF302 domain-containing protein [Chromatiaceae bacterium]|nr:MAG: DUF302 domain-containing protein [Chromatiaceae bacterium]
MVRPCRFFALTGLLVQLVVAQFAAVLPVAAALADAATESPAPYARYESSSSFEDVMTGLKLAIEERGLYINNVMAMDEMLERTGRDLGAEEVIFTRAEAVEFCSAVLSRRMTAEDPIRIVHCPFIIAVYTLPESPDTTFVAYRTVPASEVADSAVMREVAAMLQDLAEAAASW